MTHNHAVFCGQDIALIVSKVGKCGIKMIFSKFALNLDTCSNLHGQIESSAH